MPPTGESLRARFENDANALTALRLGLASMVVVWHGHLLPGRGQLWGPVLQLLEQLPVDAFFAISGFLIVRSWTQDPDWLRFVMARFTRLFPGLWVCLIASAFLIVPTALVVSGREMASAGDQIDYVLGNLTSVDWMHHRWIEGSILGVNRSVLNVSVWSLRWELACYAAVLCLGLLRWIRLRFATALLGVSWALAVSWMMIGIPDDFVFGIWPMPRLVMMFTLGAILYLHGDRIPYSGKWASIAALWLAVGAFTPDYRVFAGPALAYLVLYAGLRLGQFRRLRFKNDLSYGVYLYGAPVQQALLAIGAVGMTWVAFSVVSLAIALMFAATSWWLIERPCVRLLRAARTWRSRRSSNVSAASYSVG